MTAHELLKRTLARIEDPKHWVSGVDVVNSRGEPTLCHSLGMAFSLQGALTAETRNLQEEWTFRGSLFQEAARAIQNAAEGCDKMRSPILTLAFVSHNSTATHESCVEVLKRAISATAPKPALKCFEVTAKFSSRVVFSSQSDALQCIKLMRPDADEYSAKEVQ